MKKIVVLTGIFISVLIFGCLQFNNKKSDVDPRGELFAGSKECGKCHNKEYNSWQHTAHFRASLPATEHTVTGSFIHGLNEFVVNDSQKLVMEKLDSGLFQTYYHSGKLVDRYRFDLVLGGVKGESYLSWNGNELDQLPLSYYTGAHEWSTSPGYGFNFLDYPYLRFITKQCLECHVSYIDNFPGKTPEFNKKEQFERTSLIYSIDCERCHGPGKKHADFYSLHPDYKTQRFITSYHTLNRSQKMDICAVCHAGKPTVKLRSTFGFVPGDSLINFKVPELFQRVDTSRLDVHGNQVMLLESSKCYIKSNLDCATCHDPHQNNRGDSLLFTQKCLNCHNSPDHVYCSMTGKLSPKDLQANCISCHMPALPTRVITVQVSEKVPPIRFYVHTHRIAVYPEEVKRVLSYINTSFHSKVDLHP